MTATDALTATAGQWKLTGIEHTEGQCECCSRRLTQRVFQVTHPDHGTLTLGRRCAARATGYRPTAIEREMAVIRRTAELELRRAILDTEFPEGAARYYAAQEAARAARAAGLDGSTHYFEALGREGDLYTTALLEDGWWGGRNRTAFPTRQAYLAYYLPTATPKGSPR